MIEFNEAMKLWKERLADDCEYRRASGCTHDFGERACRIKFCPMLGPRAKLEKEVQYDFRDIKI